MSVLFYGFVRFIDEISPTDRYCLSRFPYVLGKSLIIPILLKLQYFLRFLDTTVRMAIVAGLCFDDILRSDTSPVWRVLAEAV